MLQNNVGPECGTEPELRREQGVIHPGLLLASGWVSPTFPALRLNQFSFSVVWL